MRSCQRGDGRAKWRGIVRGWRRKEGRTPTPPLPPPLRSSSPRPGRISSDPEGIEGRATSRRTLVALLLPPRPRLRIKFLFPSVGPSVRRSVRPFLAHPLTVCPRPRFPQKLSAAPLFLPILSAAQSAVLAAAPPSSWQWQSVFLVGARGGEDEEGSATIVPNPSVPWLKVGQPSLPRTLSRNSFLPSSVTVQERPTGGGALFIQTQSLSSPSPDADGPTDQARQHFEHLRSLFDAFPKVVLARCILLRCGRRPREHCHKGGGKQRERSAPPSFRRKGRGREGDPPKLGEHSSGEKVGKEREH